MKNIPSIYDNEFRQKLRDDPKQHITELGFNINDAAEVVVLTNSKNKFYFVMSASEFKADDLQAINAAVKAGTAGTGGTAATVSTVSCPASLGSLSSASTAGTVQ